MPVRWYHPSPRSKLEPIPWLHPDVIQHLENLIQPDWEVIEHGSGGSTLWFASRVKSVTAYESEAGWIEVVSAKLPPNAKVLDTGGYIGKQSCDLLLIDGEPAAKRAEWLQLVPEIVRPGGWVVLDNANRPEYAAERKHLQVYATEFKTFDVNEPHTQYLVTEFYHLPEMEGLKLPSATESKPKRRKKGSE